MKNEDLETLKHKTWGAYFMEIAKVVAVKALDDTAVGAVLVRDNLVLATGFNGFPRGVPSDQEADLVLRALEAGNKGGLNDAKNGWVVHAEHNAILNAARLGAATQGSVMYVTHRPCFRCQTALVQAGVIKVWVDDMTPWKHEPVDDEIGRLSAYLCKKSGLQILGVEDDVPESGEEAIPWARSS
jgi:dCMP deaminase